MATEKDFVTLETFFDPSFVLFRICISSQWRFLSLCLKCVKTMRPNDLCPCVRLTQNRSASYRVKVMCKNLSYKMLLLFKILSCTTWVRVWRFFSDMQMWNCSSSLSNGDHFCVKSPYLVLQYLQWCLTFIQEPWGNYSTPKNVKCIHLINQFRD